MKNFFSILLMVSSLHSYATISEFKFDVNYSFTLYPDGANNYVEYKNTRLSKGVLDVELNIGKQKESHTVKLGMNDLNKNNDLLKISSNKSRAKLLFKGKKHNIELKKVYQSPAAIRSLGDMDLLKTLQNIDKDLSLKKFSHKLVKNTLVCNPSRKYVLCEVNLAYQGTKKETKSKISELKGHLHDLKDEMALNASENYDIQGYREFLNKAENLLDESLKSSKNALQDKKEKLLTIKDLLINERIDSYEYTAIRSKSIANFVNLLISKI